MDILVGRGGNQGMIIDDESVSKIHCKIEVLDSGRMALTNLSAKGTWLNGIKLIKRTLVKPDDELRLGPTYTVQVKELLTQENYNAYTNYIYVAERYKTKGDLEAFINAAAKYSAGNMPNYVMPVVKSTMAYYEIQEDKLYDAQMLLYEVGDQLYEMQDGTELLQGIYASILDLVGKLYVEVGKYEEAKIAADAATKIFHRIKPGQFSSSEEQIESVTQLSENVNIFLGTKKIKKYIMKRDFKITKDYIETHIGHDNVKTITLPASTTQIEEFAFFDCASIETLDLSLCEEILCMPTLTTLSTQGIKKVILPPNLMEFQSACFSSWENSIEEVDMSQCNYLEEIPKDLFRGCTELKKISLPDSIKKIGFGAFNSCYSLSDINLPKSLEVLEEESFSWNKAISHIDFLACSNLRHIGVNTFFQCTSLDEIVLPDSIEELGAQSFCRCISIKKIDLSRCTKLRQIPRYCFGNDEESDFDGMQLKEILLPPSLEVIDDFSFAFCTELEELDLSNCQKLKEIGKCAFKDCKKLKTLIIPDGVETIGNFFIHNCEHLSELTLPKSLVEFPQLGAGDEENCSLKRLKVVDMHNCHLIKECTTPLVGIAENKIEVIAIPDGVELVEADFFEGLKRLKSIYLPPTLTEVEIPEDEYKNVVIYCFSPELDSLEDIVERCACLYVLPQYLNNYKEQAEAEEVSGNIEQIPDDKLYFYDE